MVSLQQKHCEGHVTLGNDSCNLCHNGTMKLQDQLQEKLPTVTALIYCAILSYLVLSHIMGCPGRRSELDFYCSASKFDVGNHCGYCREKKCQNYGEMRDNVNFIYAPFDVLTSWSQWLYLTRFYPLSYLLVCQLFEKKIIENSC